VTLSSSLINISVFISLLHFSGKTITLKFIYDMIVIGKYVFTCEGRSAKYVRQDMIFKINKLAIRKGGYISFVRIFTLINSITWS